jgi:FAD/FMN-containing dehydrogenase
VGGTRCRYGLSGGALPIEDGILIVLTRLNRILEVDLDNERVVVEPCVTNSAVSEAVAPTHFYPPDPSSQVVSTIGGNVAGKSGGLHCFKYGFTTNYVTGLDRDVSELVSSIEQLRHRFHPFACVVLDAPTEVRERIDVWRGEHEAVPLMRSVKAHFDPRGVCNRGIFVGGI